MPTCEFVVIKAKLLGIDQVPQLFWDASFQFVSIELERHQLGQTAQLFQNNSW